MSIEIRFVGGPADGRTYAVPDDVPPPLYLIPLAPPIGELFPSGRVEPPLIRKAEYEPLWQDGWPRRADDGAYLYQHRAAPVSPEERQAVERARQEARTAEERRATETDAAWQEIRRERPDFPADWRDLF